MKTKTTVQVKGADGAWVNTQHSATLEADAAYIEILLRMVESQMIPLVLKDAIKVDGGGYKGAQCKREEVTS